MFSSAFKSFASNITSNYEISKQPSSSVGVWNIFDAKKRSTGTQASIFVFDRKALEVPSAGNFGAKASSTSIRKAQDEVIERLKKEASSLARLRHPSILQLVEPVEDTRSGGLMFATESVIAPLSAALDQRDRASSQRRRNESNARSVQDVELDDLEIQKGLLQVAKGLEFLHDSAKLVHGNLTPDAIFLNAKSDWKISGLAFAGPPDNAEGHQALPRISLSEVLYSDPRVPSSVQLDLDYTSPDFVLDSNINFSADIYSLGLLLVACYREPHRSPIETHGNQATYKKILASSASAPGPQNNYGCSNKLPRELESTIPRLLARRPAGRISAAEFQQSEYFDNILVNTMRFFDNLPAKTPAEKQQFMKGLGRVMPQFPVSVLEKKILSVLLEELKDRELLAIILQNIFQILKMVPARKDLLASKVMPQLRDIFTAVSKSTERDTSKEAGLVVFLENIEIISENSSAQQFKEDALPIVHAAMQSTTHSLVDAALGTLSVVLPILDFSTVKHDLFPVIANVFAKTSSLGIKVKGLEALGVLCGALSSSKSRHDDDDFIGSKSRAEEKKTNVSSLDKFTMQEKVVPLLKGIKTKEPAVMMAALKVFQQIVKAGDIEFLATDVMPILWSFALGPLLDLSQFKAYMDLIQGLTQKIQREQIKKLQELATINRPNGADRNSLPSRTFSSGDANGTAPEDDFEKLVLGNKARESKETFAEALSDGQKLVRNAPSYSWTSSTGQTTAASTRLEAPRPQSRSITPDVSMSGFPALQPGPQPGLQSSITTSPWSQPPAPVNYASPSVAPRWGTTPAPRMQPQQQSQPPTQANMWSQPLSPQPASNASRLQATSFLSSPQPSPVMSANSQGFAPMLAPPPLSPPPTTTWQAPPQPNRLPPPMNQYQQQQQPIQQQPTQQKQGLDKYQSLL